MTSLEPSAAWHATFERTATSIARAAETEPLFRNLERGESEEQTAALLVVLAWKESRFRPRAKSRNGKWYCLYQIDKRHFPNPQAALDDPDVCTHKAMEILRGSLAHCATSPPEERLAQFMSGTCRKGRALSRSRLALAKKLVREHPRPVQVPTQPAPDTRPPPTQVATDAARTDHRPAGAQGRAPTP